MKNKNVGANCVRPEKGITLIALVITIIIMLILVAVTVSYSIKSGLLSKSKDATADYKFKEEEDEIGAVRLEYLIDEEVGKTNNKGLREYLEDELGSKFESITEDAVGNLTIKYKESKKSHIILKEKEEILKGIKYYVGDIYTNYPNEEIIKQVLKLDFDNKTYQSFKEADSTPFGNGNIDKIEESEEGYKFYSNSILFGIISKDGIKVNIDATFLLPNEATMRNVGELMLTTDYDY